MRFYTPGGNGYVDVRDVSRCMIALMESGISGERFIINAENWSYKELFSAIAGALGKPLPSTLLKRWTLEIAWRLNLAFSTLTGTEAMKRQEAVSAGFRVTRYAGEKIVQATGHTFLHAEQTKKD